jgi:hypothetical protein
MAFIFRIYVYFSYIILIKMTNSLELSTRIYNSENRKENIISITPKLDMHSTIIPTCPIIFDNMVNQMINRLNNDSVPSLNYGYAKKMKNAQKNKRPPNKMSYNSNHCIVINKNDPKFSKCLLKNDFENGRRNSCVLPKISKTVANKCQYKNRFTSRKPSELKNQDDAFLQSSIENILKQIEIRLKARKTQIPDNNIQVLKLAHSVMVNNKSFEHSPKRVRIIESPKHLRRVSDNLRKHLKPKIIANDNKITLNENNLEVSEFSPWDKKCPSSRCSISSHYSTIFGNGYGK